MVITTLNLVVLIVSVPVWGFHVSMVYFLITQIRNKSRDYSNGFFIIFTILGVVDMIYYVIAMLGITFPNFDIFFDFWKSPDAVSIHAIVCSITGFVQIFEFISHTLISFNRFTIFCRTDWHQKLWTGKPFMLIIFIMFLISSLVASYRIVNPVIVNISIDGNFDVAYHEPIQTIAIMVQIVMSFATTAVELILEIRTGIQLMIFKKHIIQHDNASRMRNETRLFIYSVVMFLFHGFLNFFYISKYISTIGNSALIKAIGGNVVDIVRKMYMLSNSLLLFLISKTVRRKYMKFYGLHKLVEPEQAPSTKINVIPRIQIATSKQI